MVELEAKTAAEPKTNEFEASVSAEVLMLLKKADEERADDDTTPAFDVYATEVEDETLAWYVSEEVVTYEKLLEDGEVTCSTLDDKEGVKTSCLEVSNELDADWGSIEARVVPEDKLGTGANQHGSASA